MNTPKHMDDNALCTHLVAHALPELRKVAISSKGKKLTTFDDLKEKLSEVDKDHHKCCRKIEVTLAASCLTAATA